MLADHSLEEREKSFRLKSGEMVETHWREIAAVANELLIHQTLDDTEVETIADIAAGVPDVSLGDLVQYRALIGRAKSDNLDT